MMASGQRTLTKGRVTYRAVVEDKMIRFAAYIAADLQCFSVGWTNPLICHSPWRDLDPI